MIYLLLYLAFGAGFYTGAAMLTPVRMPDEDLVFSLVRGFIFAFLLWPIAILTYKYWSNS